MRTTTLLAVLSLLFASSSAISQWIIDGAQVLDDPGSIQSTATAPDGSGGAYLALRVYSSSHSPYYFTVLQRVDGHGRASFGPAGIVRDLGTTSNHMSLALAPESSGHAFLGTHALYGSLYAIRLGRIDESGEAVWLGVIWSASMHLTNPKLAYDQERSTLFVAYNAGPLRLMKVDTDTGLNLWDLPGLLVTSSIDGSSVYRLVADGVGGCIVVWTDSRNGNPDLFAQRLHADGTPAWTANGVAVCDLPSVPNDFKLVPDSLGGVFVVWSDNRSGAERIYAQRVTAAGAEAWAADGVPICTTESTQFEPVAVADGQGGVLVAWRDYRSGYWALMGSRLDRNGSALWNAAGETICGVNSSKYGLALVADGAGGGVLAWHDFRSGNADIYAQRFAGDATVYWQANAVALCVDSAAQQSPMLAADGAGGAVAVWKDPRNQPDDYFAQRADRFGNWGFPAAVVQAVVDVPEDQGGWVVVGWDRSRFDDWSLNKVTRYTVWRELAFGSTGGEPLVDPDLAAKRALPLMLIEAGAASYWEKIGEVEAVANPGYAMTVPTLRDSTAADPGVIAFRVIAHAASPGEYWVSLPLAGWSVDNLAPIAPLGLAGHASYQPAGLALTWRANTEPDLIGYRLYRGPDGDFVPGPGSLVAALADTSVFDAAWQSGSHYKLTAVDMHGNEGQWTALAPEIVTAADLPLPMTTALLGAVPNPFNPATTIRFVVARESRVDLRLYDVTGRLVRRLADAVYAPGQHTVLWNGTDQTGRSTASGAYYCRFACDGVVQTRAVLLVK